MRIAVGETAHGGGTLQPLSADGAPDGPPEHVADVVSAIAERERAAAPRWVWAAAHRLYPRLLQAGVRVAQCHDLELVESLLLGHAGRYGEPRSVAAAYARLRGIEVPDDVPYAAGQSQPSLFDDAEGDHDDLDAVVAVHRDQLRRIAASEHPERLSLLAAAESAGGLCAAEMTHDGLPWRPDVHDRLLTELLGPRPAPGLRPRRLQALADEIAAAFGGRSRVNPDSPAQIVRAFGADGVTVSSARSSVLRGVDHPAVAPLLEYKELARLHAAHGWSWLDSWVRDGRFRPEYVVGGVVSGRWATRGGGALQIPKVLRRAVVADPGWVLVVADAAQLEPRVLAALAGDQAFAAAAAHGDLYTALADAFGGARDKAKIALLSAMYGGATDDAVNLLGVLRRRFPAAYGHVEAAARAGEAGHVVRSRLGRTCPPPSAAWRRHVSEPGGAGAVRGRGRFTRNFVVQASAADWALALLAVTRRRLAGMSGPEGRPHLVFFQHDEVIVHSPKERADAVAAALRAAAAEAGRLVFGDTPVVFPLEIAVDECYGAAK
ncbi:MAG TPA: bifunctional 3'-5' exonuclease/DNA polymerase [Streptosporangiaceae bacterium]|jgi:DNA polymerase-1